MKVGILSDSHDRLQRTVRAVEALMDEGAETLIHCGDYTTTEIIHACGLSPLVCVLGNNDYDVTALKAATEAIDGIWLGEGGEVILGGKRIAVTHGDNTRVFRELVRSQPDYLLFGHTHDRFNERDGPTRQINPGALHRALNYTVALLDLETDAIRFLRIR